MASGPRALHASARKPLFARYGFAVVAAVAALAAMELIKEALDVPVYSLLVGAVAVAVWYGGFACGVVCALVGWSGAVVLIVDDRGAIGMDEQEAWVSWGLGLAVAVAIVWVSFVLRRGRSRAAEAADVAEESLAGLETLHALSSALSASISVTDVVSTLVESAPAVVGAPLALGFVEDGDIAIAHPDRVLAPWQVLKLTEGRMLHRTATQGRPLLAIGRAEFEAMFPDTAALAPEAEAAVAVPLRVEGRVIGSIGFVFDRAADVSDDAETLAVVVAGLGGQALERARLFEREQESRRALDRILRVAPRFFTGSEAMVTDAICREARTVFGADIAMLWRVESDRLRLVAFDPEAASPLAAGLEATLDEFPRLHEAVESLEISFVSDVRDEARGVGLARVESLGIQSSLRAPVSIGGEAGLVLVVSWLKPVPRPDASTLALVRRFADQAGLALEQLERRRAEADAARRAVELRQLQEMTAALAHAATSAEVGAVCLDYARAALGAEGGIVVRATNDRAGIEIVARAGTGDLLPTEDLTLDSRAPAVRAVATGAPVWAMRRARRTAGAEGPPPAGGTIAMPLTSGSRLLGAVQLAFRGEPHLSDEAKERLETILSQCALALERSFLLDSELRLRRLSERLQSITADLSNALTRADVGRVLLAQVDDAVGTECAALALLGDGLGLTDLVGWRGYDDKVAERWLSLPLDAETPAGQALRRLAPVLHDARVAEGRDSFDAASTGHNWFLFVPLVLGRRPIALLVASSGQPLELDASDLRFVGTLAGQAAQALDRARRFESEQTIAETLQRSVLPASLPDVSGVGLAGRYLPGTAELEVGGDWYDAIQLPSGRLGLVVGDVVGKGVRAAATMGQLRNAIRAFSLDRLKPATTLARLSRLADEVIETSFATVAYAELDPETGICRYASAGHPPPLFASLDGRVEYLEGGRGLPLGTGLPSNYRQEAVDLPHGAVLVFYSDGLIERRGHALDEGLERLRAAVVSGPRDPERLVDHVLDHLIGDDERRDDVVVLAARYLPVAPQTLDLGLDGGYDSLRHAREALRLWLRGAPVTEMEAHDVVLASWEAVANASEHGRGEHGVKLRAELQESRIRIVVEDFGRWLEPATRTDRGRGLRLMRSLTSSVEIEPGPEGTRVTLEKELLSSVEPSLTTARSAG